MQKVISTDGTQIAYSRSGAGAPLVLVHGTSATSARWRPVVPALAAHFTVLAVDRRGRGGSGDGAGYALAREAEDIAALVDSLREPAHVLGHSYGALVALEAARLTRRLGRLILYEPVLSLPGARPYSPEAMERLQAFGKAGHPEQVLAVLFREIAGMPADEFEHFRSLPAWPARVAAAHTVARELRVEEVTQLTPGRYREIRTPVLLLAGSDSPPFLRNVTEAVAAALPNSRIAVLPGQQHIAMDTAPELFVREVMKFLI